MKIYKEVVYQVAGNKLVRVSEDSFEYSGEIIECKSSGTDIIEDTFIPNVVEAATDPLEWVGAELGDLGTPNIGSPNVDFGTYDASWMGTGQGGTMGDIAGGASYYGGKINEEWIGGAFNYIGEKMQELSDFIHNPSDPATVTVDPDVSAYSGLTANKKAAELATNKAKAQARSSLRINA